LRLKKDIVLFRKMKKQNSNCQLCFHVFGG
jgi:hypothetical protein